MSRILTTVLPLIALMAVSGAAVAADSPAQSPVSDKQAATAAEPRVQAIPSTIQVSVPLTAQTEEAEQVAQAEIYKKAATRCQVVEKALNVRCGLVDVVIGPTVFNQATGKAEATGQIRIAFAPKEAVDAAIKAEAKADPAKPAAKK